MFGTKGNDSKPTGVPDAANGVPDASITTEVSRLENLLQSGIAPRIPGIRFRQVTGFASGSVLIVRIPKSWAAPHMVTFRGATRFYSRNSTGKYPLDVYEIRSAFALSESLPERLSKFRDGRLALVVADQTPVTLPLGGRIVLHSVPITALDPAFRLGLSGMYYTVAPLLRPIAHGRGWNQRFNFDGFLTFSDNGNYSQLFRCHRSSENVVF